MRVKRIKKKQKRNITKKVAPEDFAPDVHKPTTALLVANNTDEVVEIHQNSKEMPLKDLSRDLRSLADYLSGIHTMFRTCLCDGY